MPENTLATLKDGHLLLRERPAEETINFAIDDFFISLAEDAKEKAVGIILSGMGSDGENGANVIEGYGGIVMVQDPKSAKYDSMPSHVVQEDHPDYVLPAKEMGKHLFEYMNSKEKGWHIER